MRTAVITGANSGIGKSLTNMLTDENRGVYACDLNMVPSTAQPGIHPIILDLTDPTTFTPLIDALASLPLDFLFNVAGTMAPKEQDTLTTTTLAILQMTFATDTFGPLLLTQQLLPNLLASPSPRIYNVSSRVGSIADDSTGGSYAYRASKAALNSISKSMAVDMKEKGVVVLMLHPGIVKTGLVQTSHSAEGAVEPDVAAWELWAVCKAKGMEGSCLGKVERTWGAVGEEDEAECWEVDNRIINERWC